MDELTFLIRGAPVRCVVERDGEGFVVRVGGATHRLRLFVLEPGIFRLAIAGRSHLLTFARQGVHGFLHVDGQTLAYEVSGPEGAAPGRADRGDLTAPMPGTVTEVLVRPGDRVERGQALVIVEAMKMEHAVRAPGAGRVRAVSVNPGDRVDGGTVVAAIDDESG